MKHHIKIQLLMCSLFIALLSAVPFSSYAESSGLNEQEFARVCEDNHAVQTRSLHPPLKNPAADTFNMSSITGKFCCRLTGKDS